jgi:hypothetical protein
LEDYFLYIFLIGQFESMVDDGLIIQHLIGLFPGVGEDDGLGEAVADAVGELMGGEAAENDDVGGSDAGAGEDGNNALYNHGHIDDNPVAHLHSELGPQCSCEGLHPCVQLLVGDVGSLHGRWITVPVMGLSTK